jgi:hypothetical protein
MEQPWALTPAIVEGAKSAYPYIKPAIPPWMLNLTKDAQSAAISGQPPPSTSSPADLAKMRGEGAGPSSNVETGFSNDAQGQVTSVPISSLRSDRMSPVLAPIVGNYNPARDIAARGAYQTDPGPQSSWNFTKTQMDTDDALRAQQAQRELQPLQTAAERSRLEMEASDPLAKERLVGQQAIAARRAPYEAQREFDLEDQKIIETLGPELQKELQADPDFRKLPPDQQKAYYDAALRKRIDRFKMARGKFTYREDSY